MFDPDVSYFSFVANIQATVSTSEPEGIVQTYSDEEVDICELLVCANCSCAKTGIVWLDLLFLELVSQVVIGKRFCKTNSNQRTEAAQVFHVQIHFRTNSEHVDSAAIYSYNRMVLLSPVACVNLISDSLER
jgi:hypothetical protein